MDYTEISNSIRMMIKAQGVDDKYIDKEETLYYDESGNIKHLIVKEGKLNADSDTVFVLGGVQADDTISLEELKTALGKSLEKEMKSTKDLKGSFIEILRKDNFRKNTPTDSRQRMAYSFLYCAGVVLWFCRHC